MNKNIGMVIEDLVTVDKYILADGPVAEKLIEIYNITPNSSY